MAAIGRSKKGLFFTLISVLIVTVLILGFSSRTNTSTVQDIPVVETRVEVADDYVHRLNEFYLERALFVSSYWTLEALSLYEKETGTFFPSRDEFNSRFAEVMVNGSIDGEDVDSLIGKRIMNNNTLLHRLGQIENASMAAHSIKTNFSKDLSGFNVSIRQSNQTGPWKVSVNATISYVVDATLAKWNYTTREEVYFEIYGLHDPLILVESSGNVLRRVEEAKYPVWNATTFYQHVANGTYRADFNGTSFLDRYYNNLSRSECCGIESVLDPNKMGIGDIDKSYVDWCYYTSRCPPDTTGEIWNVTGITSTDPTQNFYGLKLDDYHAVIYNQSAYH